MLKVIRIDPGSLSSYVHKVTDRLFPLRKAVCVLRLEEQYDCEGNKLLGKCSRICEHGYIVCTEDFSITLPIVIEGGRPNA